MGRFLEGEGREGGARKEYKNGEAGIEGREKGDRWEHTLGRKKRGRERGERKEICGNMGDKEGGQGEREERKEIGWKKGNRRKIGERGICLAKRGVRKQRRGIIWGKREKGKSFRRFIGRREGREGTGGKRGGR